MRVLYQHYSSLKHGAFKYIDKGYINGFKAMGHRVAIWDGEDHARLAKVLDEFKPDLFLGYLRKPGVYNNFIWTNSPSIDKLLAYKKQKGLKVALYTNPDVQSVFGEMQLGFCNNDISNAPDFYEQPAPPVEQEKALIDNSFIDAILHCYSETVTGSGYQYWLKSGIPVIVLPLAADDTLYSLPLISWHHPQFTDLLYIGGWWPFKGQQLDKFLAPMREKFQDRLKIYGKGWSDSEIKPVSDRQFNRKIWGSKINLVFHEPSQVKGQPIHVNERVYKLYASGCFTLCDANPCLKEYFEEDEVFLCETPEEMIDKAEYYLNNSSERLAFRKKARNAVLAKHTYRHRIQKLMNALD